MNIDNAVDKAFEGMAFSELINEPPSSLQGLAERVDEPLKQVGVATLEQMGTWVYYKRAKAIVTLAEKEAANGRSADSAMTLEGVVPKKFSRKTLQELLDMSPSALQGLSARFAQNLESSLSVKSIKDLGSNKYFAWAEAIAVLADTRGGQAPPTPQRAAEPGTPPPARALAVGSPAAGAVVTPNYAMTLQLEEYQVSLAGLNERLKTYISLIRERDETITELNAEKHLLKGKHQKALRDLDASYAKDLHQMQVKVDAAHAEHVRQLEQLLAAAKDKGDKESKKLTEMQSKLKQALSEHERMRSELAAARLEVGELRSAHGEGAKTTEDLKATVQRLSKEKNELQRSVQTATSAAEMSARAVAQAEEVKQAALEEAKRRLEDVHKKQREDLLMQMSTERDALKKQMLGEAGAARAQQAEKHAAQREVLESDLRKLNVLYAEAESKAELASRELDKTRDMYAELKKRYEYESSSQKIRIAELTSDISTVNKDRSEMQADFTKFVGESRTIVKEIDRYNILMTGEESRLGLPSPMPSSAAKAKGAVKRRRTEEGYEITGTPMTPASDPNNPRMEGSGILGSLRKLGPSIFGSGGH